MIALNRKMNNRFRYQESIVSSDLLEGLNIQKGEEVTGMQRKAVQENEKRDKYDVNSDWTK